MSYIPILTACGSRFVGVLHIIDVLTDFKTLNVSGRLAAWTIAAMCCCHLLSSPASISLAQSSRRSCAGDGPSFTETRSWGSGSCSCRGRKRLSSVVLSCAAGKCLVCRAPMRGADKASFGECGRGQQCSMLLQSASARQSQLGARNLQVEQQWTSDALLQSCSGCHPSWHMSKSYLLAQRISAHYPFCCDSVHQRCWSAITDA